MRLMRVWFKACPRCQQGDMYEDWDVYGRFRECLQCGYLEDLEQELEAAGQSPQLPTIATEGDRELVPA